MLLVALTITPALAAILMRRSSERHADPPLVSWLKRRCRAMLPTTIAHPKGAALLLGVSLLATAATVPFLGEEFLPNFREHDFLMHCVEKPGTSLPAMRRITVQAAKELRAIPGVRWLRRCAARFANVSWRAREKSFVSAGVSRCAAR